MTMAEALRLRTMARKSVFHGGKYDGVSVQQLLDLKQFGFLRWCYYHYSMISFQSDILEELHILEDWRIDKPGTAPEKYDQLQDRLDRKFKANVMNISEDGETAMAIATYRRWKKHRSIGTNDRRSRLYNADRVHYSKGAMQRRNHGH